MVKTDEFAFFCLPENLFYEVVLLLIPSLEIVFYKTACVTRIGIEAPEGVMEMLLGYKLSEVFHPLEVVAFHKAAPLAYKDRCNAVFLDIEPVVVPCIPVK